MILNATSGSGLVVRKEHVFRDLALLYLVVLEYLYAHLILVEELYFGLGSLLYLVQLFIQTHVLLDPVEVKEYAIIHPGAQTQTFALEEVHARKRPAIQSLVDGNLAEVEDTLLHQVVRTLRYVIQEVPADLEDVLHLQYVQEKIHAI